MNNSFPKRNVSHLIILSKHLFFSTVLCFLVRNVGFHGQRIWVIQISLTLVVQVKKNGHYKRGVMDVLFSDVIRPQLVKRECDWSVINVVHSG